MTNISAEFETFLDWFTNLEEISIYTRRDFIAHVIEVGGIDEKAAKFIDETLAHLEDNQKRHLVEFDRVNKTIRSLEDDIPKMEEQDVKNAEEEMQRIADKFCNEFRAAKQKENLDEESNEQELAKAIAEQARSDI